MQQIGLSPNKYRLELTLGKVLLCWGISKCIEICWAILKTIVKQCKVLQGIEKYWNPSGKSIIVSPSVLDLGVNVDKVWPRKSSNDHDRILMWDLSLFVHSVHSLSHCFFGERSWTQSVHPSINLQKGRLKEVCRSTHPKLFWRWRKSTSQEYSWWEANWHSILGSWEPTSVTLWNV